MQVISIDTSTRYVGVAFMMTYVPTICAVCLTCKVSIVSVCDLSNLEIWSSRILNTWISGNVILKIDFYYGPDMVYPSKSTQIPGYLNTAPRPVY